MDVRDLSVVTHSSQGAATSVSSVLFVPLFTLPAIFLASHAYASPWLEAKDPFVRSDLTQLSDAGLLRSPVNHFPLRWSAIGDDLEVSRQDKADSTSERALAHVSYSMASAQYERGNRSAKFVFGNEAPSTSGFGQFSKDTWGAYASYEHLSNSFAFRVTTGYSEYNSEKEVVWDDSYISFNAGAWLFSVGSLDRWWGQGWQHNLILGSYAQSVPEASVSYIGDNDILGGWSLEAIAGMPKDAQQDHHSAARFVAKPFSMFEFGLTYQAWFDETKFNNGDKQAALDAKLSLPHFNGLYHSVYTELASTSNTSELGAYLLGWSGQFDAANQTWRIVLEKQQSTDAKKESPTNSPSWKKGAYPSFNNQAARNSYMLDDSTSAALYLQMENDHNLSLVWQDSNYANDTQTTTNATYRLPALSGMLHFGVGYSERTNDKTQTNVWTGYEFRF